jgi:hypothetical protein
MSKFVSKLELIVDAKRRLGITTIPLPALAGGLVLPQNADAGHHVLTVAKTTILLWLEMRRSKWLLLCGAELLDLCGRPDALARSKS